MGLEDDFCDIVKKARLGHDLSPAGLARAAGISTEALFALERGQRSPTEAEAAAIAKVLGLRPRPLLDIALGRWRPAPSPGFPHIIMILGDVGGYEVRGYVLHDAGEAVLIDTAYNPSGMREALARYRARLTAICLTHGHADHADGLDVLLEGAAVPVYLGAADEGLLSWVPPRALLRRPADEEAIQVGRLTLRCMTTPGHTPGGICYRVERGDRPVCFVGDTIFAGSVGRSNPVGLYARHLQSVRERLLLLPCETVLLPGHGPGTTVAEEVAHNPFAGSGIEES